MVGQIIDRGDLITGINATVRDSRVPYTVPRSITNFRLPDGRARRRPGFSVYNKDVIKGNQLSKHTASIIERERETSTLTNPKIARTPLSYGLLRWHDDFQPRTTRDWTVEFLWTLGDIENYVINPFTRMSSNDFGQQSIKAPLRSTAGVYLFDQALLANHLTFSFDGQENTTDPTVNFATATVDTFGLSALSVSHTNSVLEVTGTLINTGVYYNDLFRITHTLPTYQQGLTLHLGIVYTTADRTVTLLVDGSPIGIYVLPAGYFFAGEQDATGGGAIPLQRDITLLNEHTARGHYSSACKVHFVNGVSNGTGNQTYGHAYAETVNLGDPDPWCCSPPRRTGMSELRIWHEARTVSQIETQRLAKLDLALLSASELDNLKGYWRLNDGGSVSFDSTENRRHCSIHHGTGSYISDTDLLGGMGILLADGQHVLKEFGPTDFKFIEDSHVHLTDVFEHDTDNLADPGVYSNKHDFTVQIQIRTPYSWQQELNRRTGATTYGGTKSDTRDMMEVLEYATYDGGEFPAPTSVRNEDGANIFGSNTEIWHRSHDATLFSIEGQAISDVGGNTVSNIDERRRVVLTRGLITPSGNVAFEWYGYVPDAGGIHSREFRAVSTTALSLDTVHTITFRKRTLFEILVAGGGARAYGFELNIYIDDSETPDVSLTVGTGLSGPSVDVGDTNFTSYCIPHGGVREVIIGSSYVNDASDGSIDGPFATGNLYGRNDDTRRFMSSFQDQPLFATLGFFRLWSIAVASRDISRWSGDSIADTPVSALLFNLEIDSVTGSDVPSKSRFSTVFRMGYKSWGLAQEHLSFSRSAHPGAYAMEDRLGYQPQPQEFRNNFENSTSHGLMFFSSTLGQEYGLLAVFDDTLYFDDNVSGTLKPLMLPNRGMLNEFATKQRWEGTVIGDRTILTAAGAVPKAYDGRVVTTAGFREWQGGNAILLFSNADGSIPAIGVNQWMAMRIVYTSENKALQHIGPIGVIRMEVSASPTDTNRLIVTNIPPHPDPRITSIYVCFSIPQGSRDLAINAAVSPVASGPLPNKYVETFVYSAIDTTVLAPIDTNITPLPVCAYSASLNGRLYLTGSLTEPDAYWWSDAGNPERFDTLTNKGVLEEGTGDKTVGMIAMFGSLFVLKPNSIWRVDEVSNNVHQQQRVAKLGPVSRRSVELVVIPESGRVTMVMWTFHGPFMFDGINFQYIGFPIETKDPYTWMDPASVFITHDVRNRDLIFHYKSRKDGVIADRHDEAIVYNYRSGSWYSYGQMVGSDSLALSFTKDTSKGFPSPSTSPLNLRSESDYVALIGGENGRIYRWGDQDSDGIKDPLAPTRFEIESSNLSGVTVVPAPDSFIWEDEELHRLWATIAKRDFSKFFSIPILSNTHTSLILDTNYAPLEFQPAAGDIIFVGRPPATVVFPWDIFGVPFSNKIVKHLITWQKGVFYHRYARDWVERAYEGWDLIPDEAGTRQKTAIQVGNCEAFKLELVSFDIDSEFDAYAYIIIFLKKETAKQPKV